MNDFDRNNSLNPNENDEILNENNGDSDNNITQNLENDAAATNNIHRNNFTARDHLFQAMFSRIALTYDRTFPPFARRFIEFMLLITALSVLFILIYIHLAFVKAPITCLDNFSFEELVGHDEASLKHMVIRVEILSNPPLNYGLFHSYSKEYDDMNAGTDYDKNSSSVLSSKNYFTQLALFLNIINKKCPKGMFVSDKDGKIIPESKESIQNSDNGNQRHSEESFFKLFHFPINPIIEKAEYWREKLSVRAMAPFRQTFNDLELFAKSVFTEEKYIMEYSLEYGLLRLSPQTRERLNIPVHFILLDATKDKCFGNALSRFILEEFVGYDQIIIGSLKRLAERQSGKGYVRNVVSGEHYRFVNSWMSRTSYLAAGFIMIIFTLSVSMLLRYSHHQIFVFIVDLLRMLENNLQFSFPAAPLLTVVLALVGMEAIMSEFFNDTSTAFYTILIIWLADQYEAVCCRTYVSKRHWPRYFYLYHFAFYAYHYRFNGQFSGLALLCSWLFIQHSMFFFFHHYELPRLMQGIAVRAIMDSLIVERADNASLTPTSGYLNEDDDSDRPGGDQRDNDEDPGSSSMPSPRTTNGTLPRMGDYKPPTQHGNVTSTSNPSGENHRPSNNSNFDSFPTNSSSLKYTTNKKLLKTNTSYHPPSFIVQKFSSELKKTNLTAMDRKTIFRVVPNFLRFVISYCEDIMDGCVLENVAPVALSGLSEDLIDQAYSIVITWVTMASFSDGVRVMEAQYCREWMGTIRNRLTTMMESSWDTDHRTMDAHVEERRTERQRPHFTVSRDYHDSGRSLDWRRRIGGTRDVVSKPRLMFSEKHAVSMKMCHQLSLSGDILADMVVKDMYKDGVKAMGRLVAVVGDSGQSVQCWVCREMVATSMDMMTAGSAGMSTGTRKGDTVCERGSSKTKPDSQRDVVCTWCDKDVLESFVVHESETMDCVETRCVRVEDCGECVAQTGDEVMKGVWSCARSTHGDDEVHKALVSVAHEGIVSTQCNGSTRSSTRSIHSVSVDLICDLGLHQSSTVFPHTGETLSMIEVDEQDQSCDPTDGLESYQHLDQVATDLAAYLSTIEEYDTHQSPSPSLYQALDTIPVFDLFPEDH